MKKKVIVITGASSGIGAAIARRFDHKNTHLVLLARRQQKLQELQKEITIANTSFFPLDITSRSAVEKKFKKIEKEIGPIDLLINNAGGAFGLDLAHQADLDDWEKCIDVNIKGLLYCTHCTLPSMVARNHGHIINIGSVAGTYPYPAGNVYGGVKAFVSQFSLNLKADLLGTNIKVSCIEPGLTGGTEFSLNRFKGDKDKANALYENTRPLLPEDIAETVHFVATLPSHVNINTIEVMPVAQAFSGFSIHRS